jgi:hypothetical protein
MGHYASNCRANRNDLKCSYCGKTGHVADTCYARNNSRLNYVDDNDLYANSTSRTQKDVKFRRGQSEMDIMPNADVLSAIINQTVPITVQELIKNHKGIESRLKNYMKRHNVPETPMMLSLLQNAYDNGTFDPEE